MKENYTLESFNLTRFSKLMKMQPNILAKFCIDELKSEGYKVKIDQNCLFAKGKAPALIVANIGDYFIDRKMPQSELSIDKIDDIAVGRKGLTIDYLRCGLYAALNIAKTTHCSILICDGPVTNYETILNFIDKNAKSLLNLKANIIVELSLTGARKTMYYSAQKKFFAEMDSAGFHNSEYDQGIILPGINLDSLCPLMNTAGINISVGYNDDKEYLNTAFLEEAENKVITIINKTAYVQHFDYLEKPIPFAEGKTKSDPILFKLYEQPVYKSKHTHTPFTDALNNEGDILPTATGRFLAMYQKPFIIQLPQSTNRIDDYAFFEFENLVEVRIPDCITKIGSNAFKYSYHLKTVHLPKELKEIKDGTFQGCSSLKEVVIPQTVTSIGKNAFEGCCDLKSIDLPKHLKSMGDSVFFNSGLISIDIPASVVSIEI